MQLGIEIVSGKQNGRRVNPSLRVQTQIGPTFLLGRWFFYWTYEKIRTYKAHHFYRQRYLTAATYISSRAFPSSLLSPTPSIAYSPTSQPVLLPGVDAFNHARGQPISWTVTYPDTNDTFQEPKISLVLHTATPKGDELFNNYGPKPNSELILGYGFSIPHNPDDTIILKIGGKSGDGKKWEIGREAQGVENMWSDLIRIFIQDPSQNPTYEDMLDASSALQEMIQNLIDRLPAEKTGEMTDIRVEVITMFQDYLEGIYRLTFLFWNKIPIQWNSGQRDILRSLMEFAKAQEFRALDMAREEGVEILFGDEEDWLDYFFCEDLFSCKYLKEWHREHAPLWEVHNYTPSRSTEGEIRSKQFLWTNRRSLEEYTGTIK